MRDNNRSTGFASPSRGRDVVDIDTKIPPHLINKLRDRVWSYQSLSKWTNESLRQGWRNGGNNIAGAPPTYLGYKNDDVLISVEEWKEAVDNLLAAINTVSATSANLFSQHFDGIRARIVPQFWSALRTYDVRVRLIHLGDSTRDLQTFDNALFASILLEDHEPHFDPPPFSTAYGLSDHFPFGGRGTNRSP